MITTRPAAFGSLQVSHVLSVFLVPCKAGWEGLSSLSFYNKETGAGGGSEAAVIYRASGEPLQTLSFPHHIHVPLTASEGSSGSLGASSIPSLQQCRAVPTAPPSKGSVACPGVERERPPSPYSKLLSTRLRNNMEEGFSELTGMNHNSCFYV